jgi:hypothetical protein
MTLKEENTFSNRTLFPNRRLSTRRPLFLIHRRVLLLSRGDFSRVPFSRGKNQEGDEAFFLMSRRFVHNGLLF